MPPFRFFMTALMSIAALAPLSALAQRDGAAEREAYANLPVCTLGADRRSLEIEPCRTAPAQQPMPRRPVPRQDFDERSGVPETPPERPVSSAILPSATLEPRSLYPTTPAVPAAPAAPVPPAVNPSPYIPPAGTYATPTPTRPSPLNCVGNVCRDAAGTVYPGSGTGVTRSPTGRHCTTTGGFVRCM